MKRILITALFIFAGFVFFGQNPPQPTNLVIGLPTASETELKLIKEDFANEPKIAFANFVGKDKVLLVEMDPKLTPFLTYTDVETILAKYFHKNHIYPKVYDSFKLVKAEYSREDKLIIK